jgi:hypothetical protein
MFFELCRSVKRCTTLRTAKWTIVGMPLNVIFEMTLGNEHLVAMRAFVVPLSFVRSHVDLQVTILCELLPTLVALEWFNTLMFSDVDIQSRFLRVALVANLAHKWFNQSVVVHVSLQMTFSDE